MRIDFESNKHHEINSQKPIVTKELPIKTKYPVAGYSDTENMWNLIY